MDSAITRSATVVARDTLDFVNPSSAVNGGIWSLFVGTSIFLFLRIWCKISRKHGLWWDDYILLASWVSTYLPAAQPPIRSIPDGNFTDMLAMLTGIADCITSDLHLYKRRACYWLCDQDVG